jgi:hypothetical protein
MTCTEATARSLRDGCAILEPGDPGSDAARRAFDLAVDQRPALVALPRDEYDVVTAVRVARERSLRVVAQSQGHDARAHRARPRGRGHARVERLYGDAAAPRARHLLARAAVRARPPAHGARASRGAAGRRRARGRAAAAGDRRPAGGHRPGIAVSAGDGRAAPRGAPETLQRGFFTHAAGPRPTPRRRRRSRPSSRSSRARSRPSAPSRSSYSASGRRRRVRRRRDAMCAPPSPLAGDSLPTAPRGSHRPPVGIVPFTNRHPVERPITCAPVAASPVARPPREPARGPLGARPDAHGVPDHGGPLRLLPRPAHRPVDHDALPARRRCDRALRAALGHERRPTRPGTSTAARARATPRARAHRRGHVRPASHPRRRAEGPRALSRLSRAGTRS